MNTPGDVNDGLDQNPGGKISNPLALEEVINEVFSSLSGEEHSFAKQIVIVRDKRALIFAKVPRSFLYSLVKILKEDPRLNFDIFLSVTAIDWMDTPLKYGSIPPSTERFQVVYHLRSLSNNYVLRLKVDLSERDLEIPSLTGLYLGADFMEREVFDMYGVIFKGHPNLKRILMYDEFVGHPLRKDYPVQHKQPRVPLRYPEVRNTATDMNRPPLASYTLPDRGLERSSFIWGGGDAYSEGTGGKLVQIGSSQIGKRQ
jgi:NADH-quinone oxidoreductase subunit C